MPSLAFFTNLAGGPGLLILLLLVLMFGAKKLPELGKSLGQTMREFSKGKDEDPEEDKKGDKKNPPLT
jgi:sec-independent protein translocase protein TatA